MRVIRFFSNRLYLSAAGVAAVFVLALAYLLTSILQLPLTGRPPQVIVEMSATGGLYQGSSVTYRGIKVGKVTDMRLVTGGVEAVVSLNGDHDIPADTRAAVRSLSPVGEQYLDFQPTSERGPYLQDGSRVEGSSTDLPKSLGSTVVAVNNVLRQIDDQKLRTVLTELATGLDGAGEEIGQLVDQGDLLLAELEKAWPQTDSLITNAGTALDIPTSQASELEELATQAKGFAQFLEGYTPELEQQIKRAPGQITELESLVEEWAEILPPFFTRFNEFVGVFSRYDPNFRYLLRNYGPGLDVLGDLVTGGALKLELIAQKEARCRYGNTASDPRSTQRREMPTNLGCPARFPQLQRGAAHAP
jgi:phospholipid/cholesterol/gamma-HCH transport system substrate-binding protein